MNFFFEINSLYRKKRGFLRIIKEVEISQNEFLQNCYFIQAHDQYYLKTRKGRLAKMEFSHHLAPITKCDVALFYKNDLIKE